MEKLPRLRLIEKYNISYFWFDRVLDVLAVVSEMSKGKYFWHQVLEMQQSEY